MPQLNLNLFDGILLLVVSPFYFPQIADKIVYGLGFLIVSFLTSLLCDVQHRSSKMLFFVAVINLT